MIASKNGHVEVVRLLCELGVAINAKDNYGDHLVKTASFFGHADVMEILGEFDADLDYSDEEGETALLTASSYVFPDSELELILSNV